MPTSASGQDELGRFVNRREWAALESLLGDGEEVRGAVDGNHGGRHGLLAATDCRLLFVTKTLFRRRVREWEYDDVFRLEVAKAVDSATITLHAHEPFVVSGVNKSAAAAFGEAVRPAIADRSYRLVEAVQDERMADPEGGTTAERLRRLERMRARKSITEPEYKVNRRRILEDAGMPTDLRKRTL